MEELLGIDVEAEEHAKTHDADGEGEKDWEEGEKKEMDDLEELMSGMGEKKKEGEKKLVDLGVLEERLKELKGRAGLGGRRTGGGESIRMET